MGCHKIRMYIVCNTYAKRHVCGSMCMICNRHTGVRFCGTYITYMQWVCRIYAIHVQVKKYRLVCKGMCMVCIRYAISI